MGQSVSLDGLTKRPGRSCVPPKSWITRRPLFQSLGGCPSTIAGGSCFERDARVAVRCATFSAFSASARASRRLSCFLPTRDDSAPSWMDVAKSGYSGTFRATG